VENNSGSRTHASLLHRLRENPNDQEAWERFVRRYALEILGWCRKWGGQEADAEDVVQEVFIKLHKALQTFSYDPTRRFRGWLRTITRHAWSDFLERRNRGFISIEGSAGLDQLATVEARDDLLSRIEQEYEREVYEDARETVRRKVAAHTWEAFDQCVGGREPSAVAALLGMTVTAVYMAKSRVQKLLKESVANLLRQEDDR
jgi:RNA polymerase sigma factor (sigma-70 family)